MKNLINSLRVINGPLVTLTSHPRNATSFILAETGRKPVNAHILGLFKMAYAEHVN
uniref:Uncharacterized protein n=1 Tax=Anguilla anguilla TaxID=7936 RepID=A0A0E9PPU6_ANGAN